MSSVTTLLSALIILHVTTGVYGVAWDFFQLSYQFWVLFNFKKSIKEKRNKRKRLFSPSDMLSKASVLSREGSWFSVINLKMSGRGDIISVLL